VETWQTGNSGFEVRVAAYSEKHAVVAGGYYVFSSKPSGVESWQEFATFRHDDPIPIRREQVRLLNDRTGFVFMGWMYAVTTDGGRTWSVWNAQHDLANWQCCNYELIKHIQLQLDGIGEMTMDPIIGRKGEVPRLCTQDYGRHWTEESCKMIRD